MHHAERRLNRDAAFLDRTKADPTVFPPEHKQQERVRDVLGPFRDDIVQGINIPLHWNHNIMTHGG